MPRDPSTNLLTELALALIQSLLKKVDYYERSPVCAILGIYQCISPVLL